MALRLTDIMIHLLLLNLLIPRYESNHYEIPIYDENVINSLIFSSKFMNKQPVIINSEIDDWCSNSDIFTIKNLYLKYGQDSFECGTSTELAMMHRINPDEITLKLYLRRVGDDVQWR